MRWLTIVAVLLLSDAGQYAHAQAVSEGAGQIEELLGVTTGFEGVTFQVRSGGCTRPEDFRVQRFGTAPVQLLLIRTVSDRCEAFVPYGTTFTLSYSRLRLGEREAFVVINPIATIQAVSRL